MKDKPEQQGEKTHARQIEILERKPEGTLHQDRKRPEGRSGVQQEAQRNTEADDGITKH